MKRLTRRRKPLWVLMMSVMLILALTSTSFADNNASEDVDGSHVFTKSGETYGDSTYLNWYEDIHGREYKITLPDDGRLQIDLNIDRGAFLDVSINKEGNAEDEWIEVCGSASKSYNGSLTTKMLSAGTYSLWFAFNHDMSAEKAFLTNEELWGYHKLSFNLTFRSLTADEKTAFKVEKNIDDLIKSDNSGRDGKVDDVQAAFDSLTDAQKNHIDQSKRDELVSIANIISDLRKDKAQAEADAKAKAEAAAKAKAEAEARAKAEAEKVKQEAESQNQSQPQSNQNTNLKVKSLWASQHSVGEVKFKWTKKDNVSVTGWNLKYRYRKIGGNNKWSGWTTKSYPASTYEAWIDVRTDYVIEIHAQAQGDSTWSTGIITCPAGGRYQAMKTAHVINDWTGSRLRETSVPGSKINHTSITMNVGETLTVKPDYEYPAWDIYSRPRLYPSHMLYDIGDKSMITITKPDGSTYTGGIIDGAATIRATRAGKTTIIFRSPNGRTMIGDVTIR